jgi:hypothetical protein
MENWYSLAISSQSEILIGNAKNYQMLGEILIYNSKDFSTPKFKFISGINPNKILFY